MRMMAGDAEPLTRYPGLFFLPICVGEVIYLHVLPEIPLVSFIIPMMTMRNSSGLKLGFTTL